MEKHFISDFQDGTRRGISTVIGVTVLVGFVVLLAALVGGVVFGLADTNQDTAFAGVTVSQTADSTVEVRVDSMGEADALLVETAGGQQVVTSPGIYKYDSFGQEVSVFGSDGETTQLLRTFNPDLESTETADILTVESDQTVQSATGNQTFQTLAAAKQAAETGDIIRFEAGIHARPDTVNETVTRPVTIVAEPNTVFSCDQTQVNLRLQNATMSQRSAFIQTNQCGFQPVTVPAPEGSGGSIDVLAGGTDTSTGNAQITTSGTDATLFDSTSESNTVSSDSQPVATAGTSVTLRVSSTSNYNSLTVNTQAGSRTFDEPGVYNVETYGYNATVSGTTGSGETVQLDTIVTEEQQPESTSETTRDGETVNETETQPVDTYLVESDGSTTVASETSDSVKRVSTLSKADSQASKGNLIKLESGVHSDPETVSTSLSTNVTLAIDSDAKLSCEQTKIDLSLGGASLSDQSPFPDVFCDKYSSVSDETVTETLNSSGVSVPETVSFDEALIYDNGGFDEITGVTTDDAGNVYVTGKSQSNNGDFDYYTIKYNSQGNEQWSQRYDSGRDDFGEGVAVDSNGNVYVTGESDRSDSNGNYLTVKYNSNGGEVWTKESGIDGARDAPRDIEVGNSGNIYVTGLSDNSGNLDYYTVKYDSAGNEVLTRRYSNGRRGIATGIAIDGNNDIYVTGSSRASDGRFDYHTIKYTSQGDKIWGERYDGGRRDSASGIAVDSEKNIYVTGFSKRSDGNFDFYTIKYNSQGDRIWSQKEDNSQADIGRQVAVDESGNVYVSGRSKGSDGQDDYYTVKYNTTGGEQWNKRYDSGSSDSPNGGISVTDNGTVYVGGTVQEDYYGLKYTG